MCRALFYLCFLHGVNPLKYFYAPNSNPPLDKKHYLSPLSTFSGTEVPITRFTDIIYKTIQNFRFLKTYRTRYDVMILHLKRFSNMIKYITYTSYDAQAL